MKSSKSGLLWVVSMTAVFGWLGAPAASAQTFAGTATGVQITVPATGTVIRAATGTMPIGGGGAYAALLVGDVPGSATGNVVSLTAGTLHSAIVGLLGTGGAASMENISLTVSGNTITADFLMARGAATCTPAVTGISQVQNLVVNGTAVTVTGNPNQTVTLPNGTLVINKQTSSVGASSASITVDALNVTTTDPVTHAELANAVLGTTNAQIDCSGGSAPNETWTTGGGWIPIGLSKGTFGVSGGVKTSGVVGHLVYQDHDIDFKINNATITDVIPGSCQTTIQGTAQGSNQGTIDFEVTVTDSTSGDTFGIHASGDVPSGDYLKLPTPLGGGNIKIHDQSCS